MSESDLQFSEAAHGSPEHQALVALRSEVLRRPLGLTFSAEQLMAERAERHVGCYRNGELIGGLLLKDLGNGWVQMRQVAVRPDMQGQGIGRALTGYAEALAARLGYHTMTLHARESAVGFYERQGYARVGERFVEITLPHWEMVKPL